MGEGTDAPKRRNSSNLKVSPGFHLSLVKLTAFLLNGAPLKGSCGCPQLTVWHALSVMVVAARWSF